MQKLDGIFSSMVEGIKSRDPRYEIMDHEHVIDTEKDVEYELKRGHTYILRKDGNIILDGEQMTESEAAVLSRLVAELPKIVADNKRIYFYSLMVNGNGEPERGLDEMKRYVP